jgi:hypothetical protein
MNSNTEDSLGYGIYRVRGCQLQASLKFYRTLEICE